MRPGDYVRSLFDPRDRVALVAIPRGEAGGRVLQKVHPAEILAAARTQAWLRHLNAQRHDIFLGVNPVRPGAWGRTKAAIGDVLRVYLDIDEDGERALARIRADARGSRLPEPTHVVRSSPGRYQVLWSVPRGALPGRHAGHRRGSRAEAARLPQLEAGRHALPLGVFQRARRAGVRVSVRSPRAARSRRCGRAGHAASRVRRGRQGQGTGRRRPRSSH